MINITTINAGAESTVTIDGLKYLIRNTEEFNIETFSLPPKQPFPTTHYEVKTFAVVGAIGSGKSTLVNSLYANCCKQLWADEIDFFNIKDMWGTLEAVKQSRKLVHYMPIDDSGPLFDCRRPMNNITVTEMYWEIRHELKDHAKSSGGNAGGLVIIPIIIQDYMGMDKRIRQALGFTVFKTFDPAITKHKMIPDPDIVRLLKKIKDQSVRVCNWDYRKLAVGVDAEEKYTLFYCDPDQYDYIPFKNIFGEDIYELQRDYLVNYLVDSVDLDVNREYIKGKLFFEVDKIKKSSEKCRITKSNFSEIITRAKTILTDKKKEEEKQKDSILIEVKAKEEIDSFVLECPQCGNRLVYKPRDLMKIPKDPKTTCKECRFVYHINRKFLIWIRNSRLQDKHKDFKDASDFSKSLNEKLTEDGGISIAGIILLQLETKFRDIDFTSMSNEELKDYINTNINPSQYLYQLDSITDCVFRELTVKRALKDHAYIETE